MPERPDDNQSPWLRWPDAEALLQRWIAALLDAMPAAQRFASLLETRTSTRLLDWVDYLIVTGGKAAGHQLREIGFEPEPVRVPARTNAFHHPGAQFPRVLVRDEGEHSDGTVSPVVLSLKCDRVADVLLTHGLSRPIHGAPRSPFREATLFEEDGRALRVTERCGYRGYVPVDFDARDVERCETAHELWCTRGRSGDDDAATMRAALDTAQRMVELVGADAAASLVMEAERDYWQRHNRAGQVQKARQDRVGLGWANHDHHTFRASRAHFPMLLRVLHALGFVDRERFYAGREAGWGAQVLEQPTAGLVVFADVDLAPDEIDIDFQSESLSPASELGTVGLWCALHGESMGRAGMHHLEAQFRFDALRDALDEQGVGMMQPFSDLPYLRQAFTAGERWAVPETRLRALHDAGWLNDEQRAQFRAHGAIGSHLENLQRRDGFKGFNQKNVSDIIGRTDPRRAGA